MDGLRIQAWRWLHRNMVFRPDHDAGDSWTLKLIQISSPSPTLPSAYSEHDVGEKQITGFLDAEDRSVTHGAGPALSASLALVVVTREEGRQYAIRTDTFLKILNSFAIDPCVLQSLTSSGCHFHGYSEPYKSRHTYHLRSFFGNTVWSFCPRTNRTRAIHISLVGSPVEQSVADFLSILRLYTAHLYTPTLLAFVALVHSVQIADNLVQTEAGSIQKCIASTKFTGRTPHGDQNVDIDELANVAERLESSLSGLNIVQHHFDLMWDLVDYLNEGQYRLARTVGLPEQPLTEAFDPYDALRPALSVIRSQVTSLESIASMWRSNAQNGFQVVSSRLSTIYHVLRGASELRRHRSSRP